MTERPAHSILGGSGASRWIPCPGSVTQSQGIPDDEDDTFSAPGTAAHAVGAHCLIEGVAAWTMMGMWVAPDDEIGDLDELQHWPDDKLICVSKEMADAVQLYVDAVNSWHPDRNQGNSYVEREFYCPTIHKHCYGKADKVYIEERTLHIWDFKYGAGIVVEAKENPQCMYYGCGVLEDLGLWDQIDQVILHIHQPRGWHMDGPHRHWSLSTSDLLVWMEDILIPAMDLALTSRETTSGEHCRFCPARGHKCPALMQDLQELEKLVAKAQGAAALTSVEIGRILDLMIPAMIVRKQALKNGTGMLNGGKKVPGWKLAKARSNRKWKDDAEKAAKKEFGAAALTKPELISPATMDGLPKGKKFAERWAFKPDAGNTLVPETDNRMEVSRDTKSNFTDVSKKRKTK